MSCVSRARESRAVGWPMVFPSGSASAPAATWPIRGGARVDWRFRWSGGARDRIRTYDLPLRRRTLYPLSYAGGAVRTLPAVQSQLAPAMRSERYLSISLTAASASLSAIASTRRVVGVVVVHGVLEVEADVVADRVLAGSRTAPAARGCARPGRSVRCRARSAATMRSSSPRRVGARPCVAQRAQLLDLLRGPAAARRGARTRPPGCGAPRGRRAGGRRRSRGPWRCRCSESDEHVGARSLAALEHPGVHEGLDGLTDGVAAHAEELGELGLGGDPGADGPLAGGDLLAQRAHGDGRSGSVRRIPTPLPRVDAVDTAGSTAHPRPLAARRSQSAP